MTTFFDIMLFVLGETMDSHVYYNISIPKIKNLWDNLRQKYITILYLL